MTADPYVRDRAGRFAPIPAVLLRDVPPIPTPIPVDGWDETGHMQDPDNPFRTLCYSPKCPHGHFRGCKRCTTPLERAAR